MGKDPAFLFYHEDFFAGVSDLSNDEVGAYIRCMCVQASKGGLTEKHMKKICETHDVFMIVVCKFIFNTETQLFENVRLKNEIIKRREYSKSRSNNRKGSKKTIDTSKTYDEHMENENEDVIEDIDKGKGGVGEKPLINGFEDPNIIRHNSYSKQCLTDQTWKEAVFMQKVTSEKSIESDLKNYCTHLISQAENKNSLKDFKSHFVNWKNKRNQDPQTQSSNNKKIFPG